MHVREQVAEGLEARDRSTELAPLPGVVARQLDQLGGGSDGFAGREHTADRQQAGEHGFALIRRQASPVRHLDSRQPDRRGRQRLVEGRRRGELDPGGVAFDQRQPPVLAIAVEHEQLAGDIRVVNRDLMALDHRHAGVARLRARCAAD